jgi:hypothetical protein
MLQAVPRVWPADAIHDTVQAVVHGPAFHRSLTSSLVDRLMRWLSDWFGRLFDFVGGRASARTLALALAAVIVLLVVVRVILAAQARDEQGWGLTRGRRAGITEDPWRAAQRLANEGLFELAAHALYRGVLASVTQRERLRLDPSKTSGDYARELRRRGSPYHEMFRAFSRRFDIAVYGHGTCDAQSFAELQLLAQSFRPQARAA